MCVGNFKLDISWEGASAANSVSLALNAATSSNYTLMPFFSANYSQQFIPAFNASAYGASFSLFFSVANSALPTVIGLTTTGTLPISGGFGFGDLYLMSIPTGFM